MKQEKRQVQKQSSSLDAGAIKEILDTEELMKAIKQHLGLNPVLKTDDNGNKSKVWEEKENNLLSKKGVENLMTTIRSHVDRNVITSQFEEDQIERTMRPLHSKVAKELFFEWDEYGIKNKSVAHKITTISTNPIWSAYLRGDSGTTLEVIGDMGDDRFESVSNQEQNQGNNGGIFSLGG